jgi:hypothetical protein
MLMPRTRPSSERKTGVTFRTSVAVNPVPEGKKPRVQAIVFQILKKNSAAASGAKPRCLGGEYREMTT